jgi:Tol biopolymer transport system component
MTRASIALGLAGPAVAAVVLISTSVSSAASHTGRATSSTCTPGAYVAEVVEVSSTVRAAGRGIRGSQARLRRGIWIRTLGRGTARLCLRQGRTRCTIGPDARVQVLPPRTNNALLRVSRARRQVSCSTLAGGRILARGQQLTLRNPALLYGARRGPSARSGGAVFSLTVGPARTVVKVRRGAAVVGRQGRPRRAVVVGRQQQVVAPARTDPQRPTKIKLSETEKQVFRELERPLPKEPDTRPPDLRIDGPPASSSLRTAVFSFSVDEPGTTFSCVLDDVVPRLCTTPQRFERLSPGPHTFVVQATDPAGNRRVRTYRWTVDGSLIAFASVREGNIDVYVMDPDGLDEVRLTDVPATDEAPAWSRDRSQIVFHSFRDGNSEIYVMNADGSDETRLTTSPTVDRNPDWSPDGRTIAFEHTRDGSLEIYLLDVGSRAGPRKLTDTPGENFDPTWSPDGTKIAFASTRDGNYELYVMNADGSGQTRLTNHPEVEFNPAWSPDGTRIAFHSRRSGVSQHIYVLDAGGGEPVELTNTVSNDYNPAWSPDGLEIVFQTDRDSQQGASATFDVYRMHADGSEATPLTSGPGNHYDPDW